ncbi:MAG: hypothetical protein NTZ69_11210 [Bacteroidia bacterium]|nr:hypothetical protein [Bacteroidia bacterium]
MKKFFFISLTALLLIGQSCGNSGSSNKNSESSSSTKIADKEPEVPVAIKNLMKFLGKWEADATFIMEGKTYKVLYLMSCIEAADGNGLYIEEGFTHPDLGVVKGANLVGFDSVDSEIKWFSVDNLGSAHEHIGVWKTPGHLGIEYNGIHDGKKYVEKVDFIFIGKDELDFKLSGTLDGVEIEMGDGVLHKK